MYIYSAEITNVVDGDTLDATIDLGFNTFTKKRLRLNRINAYETRLYKGTTEEEKALGIHARELIKEMVASATQITVNTTEKGKYGRWIAEVVVDGVNLSDFLLENGLAVEVEY